MRIAIVDIGSNTTRLLIAEVTDGKVSEEFVRRGMVTRLGAGVDATGSLNAKALTREHEALEHLAWTIEVTHAPRTVAVMTSAVRDAANGEQLAAEVRDRYGFEAHILSGDQEAQMTYLGATAELTQDSSRRLVFDIGGGSTEFVIGEGTQPGFHVSTQLGVVRQADRFIRHDPPTAEELEQLAEDVRTTISQAVPPEQRHQIDQAIGVAGTPTALAAIDQHLEDYDAAKVHGYQLTAEACAAIFERLKTMTLDQRKRVIGLHPARANVIIPGAVILKEVMDLFELEAIEVSEHDILRGAALTYAGR
jgi:exopolyphosphatase / guanosine-5'-triphosphate,3'-diphosphate pyrophosphatase